MFMSPDLYSEEARGDAVGRAGRSRFDSQWCRWNFSLTQSFRPHCDSEVDSASNRNEYQEYFLGGKGRRCLGLTTLPPSCADCLEIWEPQTLGTLSACPDLYRDCFALYSEGPFFDSFRPPNSVLLICFVHSPSSLKP